MFDASITAWLLKVTPEMVQEVTLSIPPPKLNNALVTIANSEDGVIERDESETVQLVGAERVKIEAVVDVMRKLRFVIFTMSRKRMSEVTENRESVTLMD